MNRFLAVAGCVALAACQTDPIVDLQYSRTPQNYQADLATCNRIADEAGSPVATTATRAVIGAAVGAALGAATGAIVGSPGTGAAVGAVTGGGAGTIFGASESHNDRRTIVANCMRNRGYAVLR